MVIAEISTAATFVGMEWCCVVIATLYVDQSHPYILLNFVKSVSYYLYWWPIQQSSVWPGERVPLMINATDELGNAAGSFLRLTLSPNTSLYSTNKVWFYKNHNIITFQISAVALCMNVAAEWRECPYHTRLPYTFPSTSNNYFHLQAGMQLH